MSQINLCHLEEVEGDRYRSIYDFYQGTYDEIILFLTPAATTTLAAVKSDFDYLVKWWSGCCSALAYLHLHGIMHCDVKPQNIGVIFSPTARAVILDFGSCFKGPRSHDHRVGTIRYLAPEVISFKEWDTAGRVGPRPSQYTDRVDIWGVGIAFLEAFRGLVPWTQVSKAEWRKYLDSVRAPLTSTSARFLDQQVRRAVCWDTEARPSAAELTEATESFLGDDKSYEKRRRLA